MNTMYGAAVLVVGVAGLGQAFAQGFPEHEITLTVNYGAGGNTDVATRALAHGMERHLGKPVVIVNKGGAMGTLSVGQLARQKGDGYQIGVVTYSTQAIAPHLMNVPYTMADFSFICGYGRFRYGVAVLASSPYKSLQDLVAASKSGPGILFGAPSSPNNLALFELGRVTGGKFEQVSYKSGVETVTALLGGQVEVIVQNPSDIVPHVKSGRLRMLASASPMRWQEFPDIPTMREAGYAVDIDSWLGLAAPKGTPAAVLEKLQDACVGAVNDEAINRNIGQVGVDPAALSGADYLETLKKGFEEMGRAIRSANLPRISG